MTQCLRFCSNAPRPYLVGLTSPRKSRTATNAAISGKIIYSFHRTVFATCRTDRSGWNVALKEHSSLLAPLLNLEENKIQPMLLDML